MSKPIDPTQIASLIQADDKVQQTKQAAQIRRKIFPSEPRTYDTWFKLETHYRECTNPHCIDPRKKEANEKTMVAEVNGSEICRYCFLEGVNRTAA